MVGCGWECNLLLGKAAPSAAATLSSTQWLIAAKIAILTQMTNEQASVVLGMSSHCLNTAQMMKEQ